MKSLFYTLVFIFLSLVALVTKTLPAYAAESTCDVTQYNFTGEYTKVGPPGSTSCNSGDCEVSRRGSRSGTIFTCWPVGATPQGTTCPGSCSLGPPFTCEQSGCTPNVQASRGGGICNSCVAGVPPRSLSCGDSCTSSLECPSECGTCRGDTPFSTNKTCRAPVTSSSLPPYDPTCGPDRNGDGKPDDVKTGLGCLPTDPQYFINMVIPWAIGIGAGIAFLLGLYGALMIVISAGDPEKMQAGKEIITSAIAGLLLIVFAVFILRVIGVNILGLFGFPTEDVDFGGRR